MFLIMDSVATLTEFNLLCNLKPIVFYLYAPQFPHLLKGDNICTSC